MKRVNRLRTVFPKSSKYYYVHGRKRSARYITRIARIHKAYYAVLFVGLSLGFSAVFQVPSTHESRRTPDTRATVSAKGKPGVSSPLRNTKQTATPAAQQTKTPANSTIVPAKPAWVSMPLYLDPYNEPATYLANNPSSPDSAVFARLAQTPVAQWFGDWNSNVQQDANTYVSAAAASGKVPVLVAYNIPNRDCGGYSIGGAGGKAVYTQWVRSLAAGIGNRTAVVILEPDALGALDCLPAPQQPERSQALAQAVTILKANPQTSVYIDAGTPVWQPAPTMAKRLQAANIAAADGFSINVSYFATTTQNRAYGDKLSSLVGNKHYVIDTSRNGGNNSMTGMQCNPGFASYGEAPTTNISNPRNDALLWIKIPWESDGACNGSPGPGEPFWSYALQLAKNAGW